MRFRFGPVQHEDRLGHRPPPRLLMPAGRQHGDRRLCPAGAPLSAFTAPRKGRRRRFCRGQCRHTQVTRRLSRPCSLPCALRRRACCICSSRFSGAPGMMRSPTRKCGVPWMPILVASARVSSISFFTSARGHVLLERAMSRPSFSAMRSADASLAWPWASSMARWNSQYLPCILAAKRHLRGLLRAFAQDRKLLQDQLRPACPCRRAARRRRTPSCSSRSCSRRTRSR